MHKSLRRTALALSAVAALLLAGGTPAFAAETEDDSGPGENPPAVQAEIDRLTAEGAEIIKVSTTPYVAEETPGTVSTMSAYPSGCGLSVIISKFGFVITGSSISSCWSGGSFTSNTMNSTMTHYNPDWNVWDSTVATGSKTTGLSSSASLDITYNCNNNLSSNYRVATSGSLARGGNVYYAGAYDVFDSNVACGT